MSGRLRYLMCSIDKFLIPHRIVYSMTFIVYLIQYLTVYRFTFKTIVLFAKLFPIKWLRTPHIIIKYRNAIRYIQICSSPFYIAILLSCVWAMEKVGELTPLETKIRLHHVDFFSSISTSFLLCLSHRVFFGTLTQKCYIIWIANITAIKMLMFLKSRAIGIPILRFAGRTKSF